jgi:hypothetical protein
MCSCLTLTGAEEVDIGFKDEVAAAVEEDNVLEEEEAPMCRDFPLEVD